MSQDNENNEFVTFEEDDREYTMEDCEPSDEQVVYSNILFYGAWTAIVLMMVTYAIYVSGIATPHVPPKEVPNLWTLPVSEYLHEAEIPHGWGWTGMLRKGDFLNFTGMVLLAGMTIICFAAALIPAYFKKKDWIYLGLVVFECIVLIVAASGVLGAGGH